MHPIGDSIGEPALDFEAWRVLIQSFCGRYNPEGIEPSVFAGWVHPFSLWEFLALDFVMRTALAASMNVRKIVEEHS